MPVKAAGWRMEPPVSVPVAPGARNAATAAAEPPEEPPGTSLVFAPLRRHGDVTAPKHDVSFDEPIANSSLLVLPSSTAPSRHRLPLTVDSYVGTNGSRIRLPALVRTPAVQNMSLTAIGMPSSGRAAAPRRCASAACAMARARSGVSST